MRIDVYSEGFELTPQLRSKVVSRFVWALGAFDSHVESVVVRLMSGTGHMESQTAICDVVVSLRSFGDVRARAEEARMPLAIEGAAEEVRGVVEREASRLQAVGRAPHAADGPAGVSQ